MKKTIVIMLAMVFGFVCSANAQTIISKTQSTVRVDYNMDGIWDTEVNISRVPNNGFMRINSTLANELGRCYIINLWRQYKAQGVNPASYGIPNPNSEANFTQYASAYSHLISYSGMVGGMGIPGTASVGVNIGGVGVGVSIPVTNANNGLGGILTPNATIGVNVKGNGGVISLPVGIKVGSKKARRQTTTTVPAQQTTRMVTPTTTTTTTTPTTTPTTTTSTPTNTRVVEMSVDEIQNMLDGSYM